MSPPVRGIGLSLVAAAALSVAVAFGFAGAREEDKAPFAELRGYGAFRAENSLNGQAIFSAPNLAPGRSETGLVAIRNGHDAPGGLKLSQSLGAEQPGAGAARLFTALVLRVRDVGDGPGSLVYSGPLSAMGVTRLKDLARGERRTYEFTVTLPASASDSLQGAGVSVDYTWTPAPSGSRGALCARGRRGGRKGESIAGGFKGDRILGKGGADSIRGRRGRDCLFGGRGDDHLDGGAGGDRLRGGYGNDELLGGRGNDGVRGRQGNDVILGGPGRDTLRGSSGEDLIRADDGVPDKVRCGPGRDVAVLDALDSAQGCESSRISG